MPISPVASAPVYDRQISVWDPLVRVGHWVLVLGFATAYLSGDEEAGASNALHAWSGYLVGVVVVLRVVWGFIGSLHARFSDFAYSPAQAARYLIDLVKGKAGRYLGHSPAGGAMVIALLICLAGTVATGLMAYAEQGKGPLAGMTSMLAAPSRADDALEELHGVLANVTLALVGLHVLGVGIASIVHRENLVRSMIYGRKRNDG
jgi:cytochrome b